MEYSYFYLCYGSKYEENNDERSEVDYMDNDEPMYIWQKELCEQLDDYYKNGWELVQLSNDLITGKKVDGYGLFRRRKQ